MQDLWSYKGMRVIVAGCHSGIGEATARELVRLGAEVHGLDIRPCPTELASFQNCDLREREDIDRALNRIEGKIDCLFYCAGLPQSFPAMEVIQVNFLSVRYFVEKITPRMNPGGAIAIIASTAGNGYMQRLPVINELIATPDYDAGMAWAEPRLGELGDPYTFSKEAIIVWGLLQSQTLIHQDIRINLLSPGPTISGMTRHFESVASPALIDVFTAPINRRSTSEEQCYPLIFLNCRGASYVNGLNLRADGGFTAGVMLGQIDVEGLMAQASAA